MRERKLYCSSKLAECMHSKIPHIPTKIVFYSHDSRIKDSDIGNDIKTRIEEIINKHGFKLYTTEEADTVITSEYFCTNICQKIKECAFLVADISDWDEDENQKNKKYYSKLESRKYYSNPNVMQEIGLALGYEKHIIIITTDRKKTPSNLLGFNIFLYPRDFKEKINYAIKELKERHVYLDKFKIIANPKDFYSLLYEIERKIKTNRILAQTYPGAIWRPDSLISKRGQERCLDPNLYKEIITKRKKIFNEDIKSFKFTDIYEKEGITKYVKTQKWEGSKIKANSAEVKQHLQNIIAALKENRNYEVALTVERIPYNFEVRTGEIVILESKGIHPGITGMLFTTMDAISEFEKQANSLIENAKIKAKEDVIAWLEQQVRKA